MIAELPGVTMILADASNYRPRPAADAPCAACGQLHHGYDQVVIHGTSGHADPRPPALELQKPGHGSSFHFVVGQKPLVVYQCVPLRFAAQHAHKDVNPRSVGVEHSMREPHELGPTDLGLPPTEEQYRLSARIVGYLVVAAGLPLDRRHVVGHSEVDRYTTHTGCPQACGWDWAHYMPMVADACAAIRAGQ